MVPLGGRSCILVVILDVAGARLGIYVYRRQGVAVGVGEIAMQVDSQSLAQNIAIAIFGTPCSSLIIRNF